MTENITESTAESTAEKLRALITAANQPELAEQDGMVYQVWNDGEVTLQKSGYLLWSRNLHLVMKGDEERAVPLSYFPGNWTGEDHAYIFCDKESAEAIHRMITGRDW